MTHQEIIEILPWFVNGTLDSQEREAVEAHLPTCQECAQELEELFHDQAFWVELDQQTPQTLPSQLNQLHQQIEALEKEKNQKESLGTVFSEWLSKLTQLWEHSLTPVPTFAQAVIAVQFVCILGLGVGFFSVWQQDRKFTTLTGGTSASTEKQVTTISLNFHETATIKEINKIITSIQGKLIEGPTSLGLYTVEIPIPPNNTKAIDAALRSLRENPEVIQFAELKL